jgi:hypothetical protein
MANVRNCSVTTPETPDVPDVTADGDVLKVLQQCLQEYRTEMAKYRAKYKGFSAARPVYDDAFQYWYNGWLNRCKDVIPGIDRNGEVGPQSPGREGAGGGENGGHGGAGGQDGGPGAI